VKIILPLPPNMANGRMHWRVKHNKRKAYFEACDSGCSLQFGGMRFPPTGRVKLRATIYCGGQMDHDNAIARLKWPVDWMVAFGYLIGDRPSQLEWHWPITQVVGRKQQYRVEFELEAA
jgi:hypothetical protein